MRRSEIADRGKSGITLGSAPQSLRGRRQEAEAPLSTDLEEQFLDEEALRRHLSELAANAADWVVTLKDSTAAPPRPVNLDELISPLVKRRAFGGQVEFSLGGYRWLDTLVATRDGIRLVRLQLTS